MMTANATNAPKLVLVTKLDVSTEQGHSGGLVAVGMDGGISEVMGSGSGVGVGAGAGAGGE